MAVRLALSAVLLVPLIVHGEEFVGPPAPSFTGEIMNALDTKRDYVSEKFVNFVSGIDRFFGDDRHYQEANDSVLQLDVVRVFGYTGEHRFVLSARANVHLPIAEQKLHLLIETDPEQNTVSDSKQTQLQPQPANQQDTTQGLAAALRYVKAEAERWHLSADAGLKFHGINTAPFARTRASLEAPMGEWRAKLAETAFWFNSIGAGETTQLDFERTLSETVLLRATSNATWLHRKQNFDMRQDLTVFHQLDERTALLYQASVIGVSNPQAQVMDYVLLMSYRYRLHREWMYFDVSPQLHFPRERSFRASPLLSLRLEILFDESK
jgi:hypothetical protein